MVQPADTWERTGPALRVGKLQLRFEYGLVAAAGIFAAAGAAALLMLNPGQEEIQRWGYSGLFAVMLLRTASILVPLPGGGIVLAAGAFLDPVWGIPAPLAVGVVAGVAEALGEFTGYGAGRSGSPILEGRAFYERVRRWISRRAFLALFVMGLAPPPVSDVAGIAAGAARVPVRVFFPAVLGGKVLHNIAHAGLGYYALRVIEAMF